jgi:DMSO/TMAO reductase YedYZ molybdopterin-dependent catalytic subunit
MIGTPLSIAGQVERPLVLTRAELEELADCELVSDFNCLEGWSRPGLRWRGVRLATLLALADAHDSGRS